MQRIFILLLLSINSIKRLLLRLLFNMYSKNYYRNEFSITVTIPVPLRQINVISSNNCLICYFFKYLFQIVIISNYNLFYYNYNLFIKCLIVLNDDKK